MAFKKDKISQQERTIANYWSFYDRPRILIAFATILAFIRYWYLMGVAGVVLTVLIDIQDSKYKIISLENGKISVTTSKSFLMRLFRKKEMFSLKEIEVDVLKLIDSGGTKLTLIEKKTKLEIFSRTFEKKEPDYNSGLEFITALKLIMK